MTDKDCIAMFNLSARRRKERKEGKEFPSSKRDSNPQIQMAQ